MTKNKEQRNLGSALSKSEKSDLKSNSNLEWIERLRILNNLKQRNSMTEKK